VRAIQYPVTAPIMAPAQLTTLPITTPNKAPDAWRGECHIPCLRRRDSCHFMS
jgi:hypothetical protein